MNSFAGLTLVIGSKTNLKVQGLSIIDGKWANARISASQETSEKISYEFSRFCASSKHQRLDFGALLVIKNHPMVGIKMKRKTLLSLFTILREFVRKNTMVLL